jgi:transglutaminase-like putative cysteine protease
VGVCQDFAHLTVALLRAAGIAARYVSGYLYAADPSSSAAAGEDGPMHVQTHAWVEAAVPGHGWWAIDPTNGAAVGERHVVIGRGRDYDDVAPMRGVYFGETEHRLTASVTMSSGASPAEGNVQQ